MARFWKEFKYSLRMRKHLFFLLMIIMGLVSAVYLFRESLETSLEKAFPNEYGLVTEGKTEAYHIEGSYAEHATAKDVDIQAELTINRSLHDAAWMDYEEGFLYELYVKDYTGPDKAVIGYGTDKLDANKAVDMDKGKYGKVQSAWLSQEVLDAAGFGGLTSRLFSASSSYTESLYVMLGAGMQGGKYDAGTKLTLRVEGVKMEAVVLGFMDPGTTLLVGNEPVCLDFYVVCPLLDLSELYGGGLGETGMPTNTDPIYMQDTLFTEDGHFEDTETARREIEKDNVRYVAAKCLWITDEDIAALDEVPGWLQTLSNTKATGGMMSAWFGNNYQEAGLTRGKNLTAMTLYDGKKTIVCNGFIPEGETFTLGDKTLNLDEYIVVALKTSDSSNTSQDDKNADSDDGEKDKESGLQVEQRTLLFRLLVKKNSGVIRTKYTADESQVKLETILEGAWENYQKDNPDLERTSTYKVKEADKPGSVIYRDKIREVPKKLTKIDSIGYIVCIALLLLYVVYKFFKGSDYYTALVLTGDTKLEIVLLFLAELAVLFVFACGLAFGLSWVVCKLLGLGAVVIKPIITKNLRIVAIPFAVVVALVIAKDFGKIFRRR